MSLARLQDIRLIYLKISYAVLLYWQETIVN